MGIEVSREQLLREQERSGKSIVGFSGERGIDPKMLYEQRRLRRRRKAAPTFVRVPLGITVTVELQSGIKLTHPLESLNAVLRELEAR